MWFPCKKLLGWCGGLCQSILNGFSVALVIWIYVTLCIYFLLLYYIFLIATIVNHCVSRHLPSRFNIKKNMDHEKWFKWERFYTAGTIWDKDRQWRSSIKVNVVKIKATPKVICFYSFIFKIFLLRHYAKCFLSFLTFIHLFFLLLLVTLTAYTTFDADGNFLGQIRGTIKIEKWILLWMILRNYLLLGIFKNLSAL